MIDGGRERTGFESVDDADLIAAAKQRPLEVRRRLFPHLNSTPERQEVADA